MNGGGLWPRPKLYSDGLLTSTIARLGVALILLGWLPVVFDGRRGKMVVVDQVSQAHKE